MSRLVKKDFSCRCFCGYLPEHHEERGLDALLKGNLSAKKRVAPDSQCLAPCLTLQQHEMFLGNGRGWLDEC